MKMNMPAPFIHIKNLAIILLLSSLLSACTEQSREKTPKKITSSETYETTHKIIRIFDELATLKKRAEDIHSSGKTPVLNKEGYHSETEKDLDWQGSELLSSLTVHRNTPAQTALIATLSEHTHPYLKNTQMVFLRQEDGQWSCTFYTQDKDVSKKMIPMACNIAAGEYPQ